MSEQDDESLAQQISSYTDTELRQIEQMTIEVRDYWKSMLKDQSNSLNEGTKLAIESSIKQAEEDLVTIRLKMNSTS